MKKTFLTKTLLGMAVFFVPTVILNYFTTNALSVVSELSFVQCTLTVGIFIMVYNFYKEWKESQSQDDNKP